MHAVNRPHAGVVATGIAVVGIAALATTPLVSPPPAASPPAVSRDVRLAADAVPPGGIITSFLNNQVIYCSIICPLLVETAGTAVVTTVASPAAFVAALQSGNPLKALGAAAASVTGPTNAAATAAIVADGTLVAPRVLNAFETGVVGLLNVVPAAAGGLPAVLSALEAARQNTFDAQHTPIVPNPPPTVMPQGVVQVAAVGALNVVGAVVFQGLNQVLLGVFRTPDAIAQELAATGDPVRAAAAGVTAAAGAATAAVDVVANSVVTAVQDIETAAGQSRPANTTTQIERHSDATMFARPRLDSTHGAATTTERVKNKPDGVQSLRGLVSTAHEGVRTIKKTGSEQPHRINVGSAGNTPKHRLKRP
ncbi:hypothetical protein A5662_25345 [Mycobacteriaceae bacterium 1482268.1]|nr:hypothetical protein A5662_25345 [Mycobacteriaceae bacterium 1482268.1]